MTRRVLGVLAGILMITAIAPPTAHAVEWVPKPAPLTTPWTDQVSPTNALPEYPRPQLVRQEWQNLNGVWEFAGAPNLNTPPFGRPLAEGVLVPYPIESALSGIKRHEDNMFYRRTFTVPSTWDGRNGCKLNFGAVTWETQGLGQRHAGRHAHRRLRRVLLRHHRPRSRRAQRDHRRRALAGRRQPLPDRQAAPQPRAASSTPPRPASGRRCGWSRCGPRTSPGSTPRRTSPRARSTWSCRAPPGRPVTSRGAPRRSGRRHGDRHDRRTPAGPGAERPPVVAGRPVPLRPARDARRRRRRSPATSACARSARRWSAASCGRC